MARPARIEFPGAFYHIIVRGNDRQIIFLDDQDRTEYLERVMRYKQERGFILYAYVLMSNHVHLLIETPLAPISRIMQLINLTYTQYFNRKYGKVGHLFQGRYKSLLCDRDEYLISLVRYIHLNPVRAGMVQNPGNYTWSSHNAYLAGDKTIVDYDRVLRLFSERSVQARKLYAEFVHETIAAGSDGSFYNAVGQQVVGDEHFIENVERSVDLRHAPLQKPGMSKILRVVEEVSGVGKETIAGRSRGEVAVNARRALALSAREYGYRLSALKPLLKRDVSVISKLSNCDRECAAMKMMEKIISILNA